MIALALALAWAGAAAEAGEERASEGAWSFAAVPRFTLSSDDGVGLGVRGTAFWHRFNASPYKTAIHFQAYATSNLVQHHFVRVDAIDAFNVPLRLDAEAALFSTITANFCGTGDIVDVPTCADGDGSRHRWFAPSLSATARWRVSGSAKARVELVGGYRGALIVPGAITFDGFDGGPYPGSVVAALDPAGDPGFASTVLAGVAIDTRDFELAPTRGVFASLVVRGADAITGSTWTYVGATGALSVFEPLSDRVVLAERLVVDVLAGDAPLVELMRVGGMQESFALGGQDLGRGLRVSRFAGAAKVASQHELRFAAFGFEVLGNDVDVGVAAFVDVGVVAPTARDLVARVEDLPRALVVDDVRVPVPSWGAGLALRTSWNRAFIMRIDVAWSPDDPTRPGLYTGPGHPF